MNKHCWVNFKFTLVWTSSLLGKLEVYTILDKMATDQTEFVYLKISPTYVKTHNSIFAFARIRFQKVQSTQIQFRKVRSTSIQLSIVRSTG